MAPDSFASLSIRIDTLDARMDRTSTEIKSGFQEMKTLIRDHSNQVKEDHDEVKGELRNISNQTQTQETRLALVEKMLEQEQERSKELAKAVQQNTLTLAKATAIAFASALIIPVVAEGIWNWLADHPPESVMSRSTIAAATGGHTALPNNLFCTVLLHSSSHGGSCGHPIPRATSGPQSPRIPSGPRELHSTTAK